MDRTLSDATSLARMDPGAMAMKGFSTFPLKLQHYWNLTIRLFSFISRTLVGGGGLTPSAEKLLVYSTAQADWAREGKRTVKIRQKARMKEN